MRHKRRSVLETAGHDVEPRRRSGRALARPAAAALADAAASGRQHGARGDRGARGRSPTPAGSGLPGGLGSLRLQGRLADGVRWSLGGLVAENEGRAWRMAAEFVLEPGGGHEIEVGAGLRRGRHAATLLADGAAASPTARSGPCSRRTAGSSATG